MTDRKELLYRITQAEQGMALGKYLRGKGFSQHFLTQLKQEGLLVNGAFHRMIDPLEVGDSIRVDLRGGGSDLKPNGAIQAPVIYEDEDFLAFDKPPDILVHPCAKGFDDALGNYFVYLHPDLAFRPLGRLDRDTTGVCLVAKHLPASAAARQLEKTYLAVAQGVMEQEEGLIDLPLLRQGGPKIKQVVDDLGKPSLTQYRQIATNGKYSLLQIRLLTGRTHQIRAHLAFLGHPLAGDSLYGGSCELISRQALHCTSVSFKQPITGEAIRIVSPLPSDMAGMMK